MKPTNSELKKRADKVFIGNYLRYPSAMISGQGCTLTDADGKTYIDFLSGIAVCSLGHCHPAVTRAVSEQAASLVHVSNFYYTEPQTELAELLVANSFADKVFFSNSGAEANEAAIKLARICSPAGKYEIITLKGSFHGRTLATVTATAQPKFHAGFEPMPEGFVYADFGSLEAIESLISDNTCAIMCEPLQGEAGVRPLEQEYLEGIRALCDRHDLLLILDEVQTGMGRTGKLFGYQHTVIEPDIMTLAKALGNGMPIGAMLTNETLAAKLVPGTHASTFGGNPVAAAAGVATMKVMLANGFLAGVNEQGDYLASQLEKLAMQFPTLASGVRGLGLIRGLVLTDKGVAVGAEIVSKMLEKGFLINFAGNSVLRFVPPFLITRDEIDQMVYALSEVLSDYHR
ncbi:MAG: aspartate aminotransferase family protein [Desulfobulbaceae bacterium]|nr:MAG: aspartate aminotransferase family protein [Desulfobulbaceae bacterium]